MGKYNKFAAQSVIESCISQKNVLLKGNEFFYNDIIGYWQKNAKTLLNITRNKNVNSKILRDTTFFLY